MPESFYPDHVFIPDGLPDIEAVRRAYFDAPARRSLAFGTTGYRGSSLRQTFNEAHVAALTQAVCDCRGRSGRTGPLFLSKDTHALSEPAFHTALEVLRANGVQVFTHEPDTFAPTPLVSRAITLHNRSNPNAKADGIILSPSHNPPEDGGFKYTPLGASAEDKALLKALSERTNLYLSSGLQGVKRCSLPPKIFADTIRFFDFVTPYVRDLGKVLDMESIRAFGKFAVDAQAGAALAVWPSVAQTYHLEIDFFNLKPDPAFSFLNPDFDGKRRPDCSSIRAEAHFIERCSACPLALCNDPDADRYGILVNGQLLNPNRFFAMAADYLFNHRPLWPKNGAVGKSFPTTVRVDRVAEAANRKVVETPVGFKWFNDGLEKGELLLAGEESAGMVFAQKDGSLWCLEKDGITPALLAVEMSAEHPGGLTGYDTEIAGRFGESFYARTDIPLPDDSPRTLPDFNCQTLAGSPVRKSRTQSRNGEKIGGVILETDNGWLAVRPSGNESMLKIYAESFCSEEHLESMLQSAKACVLNALKPV